MSEISSPSRFASAPLSASTLHAPSASAAWTARLELLLESTGEGIFGIDMRRPLHLHQPRRRASMLGFAPAEVLGRNMHELTHHTHADGSHYPDSRVPDLQRLPRGLPCRIDTEVFWRRDGSAVRGRVFQSYPIIDGGEVRGAVVTFVDITERKRAERRAAAGATTSWSSGWPSAPRELAARWQQLRELSAYFETVREEERTRIAREVHDELGSLLVALKMDVNWLDKRLASSSGASPRPRRPCATPCAASART